MSYRITWMERNNDGLADTFAEAQAMALDWAEEYQRDTGEIEDELPTIWALVGTVSPRLSAAADDEDGTRYVDGYEIEGDLDVCLQVAAQAGLLPEQSLHAQALAACGFPTTAMTDRELAIALLEWGTRVASRPGSPRWATYPLAHGSGMSQALLRAAGIDPDEECRPRPDEDGEE